MQTLARLALTAPRRIVAIALLVMVAMAVFGIPCVKSLAGGGFQDPGSESARAAAVMEHKFHRTDTKMLILVSSPDGATSPKVRAVGTEIAGKLNSSPYVAHVLSPWDAPPQIAASLISKDAKSALIVADLVGGERNSPAYAQKLSDEVIHDRDGVTVRAGGSAAIDAQISEQTESDLLMMESIAVPLSFLVLVAVFGGLVAAALPVFVSGLAIFGSMTVLRALTYTTDVSIFALNLATAMGLALSIDYTLLILSRYRDELADGAPRDQALVQTMATAGRTVLFSSVTVMLAMMPMLLFPMYFLKSFAYAGIAVVVFAAAGALLVTPALIVLLGDRLDSLDVRRLFRRRSRGVDAPRRAEQTFWYRSTKFVVRHSIPAALGVTVLLLILGAPFLGVHSGVPDDRVLPRSASAHHVGDVLRTEFATDSAKNIEVVMPDATGVTAVDLGHYAARLSQVPDVTWVSSPAGMFAGGQQIGPPAGTAAVGDGSAYLTVASTAPLFSHRSQTQLQALHAVPRPDNASILLSGYAQMNNDTVAAVTGRLPVVLTVIAVASFVLLFALTGSIVVPLKTLLLSVISLSATFGALVWIFQDGHLGALGTTNTHTLDLNMPVLLFCIAFGLSMDYEVFLIARTREYWLQSGRTRADNDESVALGLAHTGRVITAAAAIMAIAFAALTAAQVSFMRMFGVGLTVAILVDATLVRMVLVPAFMHLLGRANWWAPKPLAWLHSRPGLRESPEPLRHVPHDEASHAEPLPEPNPLSTKV
ncbi:MAG: MMPL family transporter [Mycobacterium sp.]|uniref:MMPL family transporter n=1 Tax=Mycobacterium sp. TaxID=1785 RepID=UPI001EB35FB5|nr:MMPL family transporter [Mycobacterium sp.]MBV8790346.1 MMPL family transporter [Mycobacterium sp.]